jgi:predicted dehydrogenase
VPDRWRDRPGPGAGLWWDLGPHLVDQALQLMGRPDAVTADLAAQRHGASVDDHVHVILHFGSRRAVLRAGCLVSAPVFRLAADGETGAFTTTGFDPQEGMLREGADACDPQPQRWGELRLQDGGGAPEVQRRQLVSGDYGAFYEGMRQAVATGARVPVSVESALAVMEILDLAQRSAEERRTVEVAATA